MEIENRNKKNMWDEEVWIWIMGKSVSKGCSQGWPSKIGFANTNGPATQLTQGWPQVFECIHMQYIYTSCTVRLELVSVCSLTKFGIPCTYSHAQGLRAVSLLAGMSLQQPGWVGSASSFHSTVCQVSTEFRWKLEQKLDVADPRQLPQGFALLSSCLTKVLQRFH